MPDATAIDDFITHWRETGGSELANTQSFINGLCALLGVAVPNGSRADDAHNDYVFERRVFQDNGDGTRDFGRIDAYRPIAEGVRTPPSVGPARRPHTDKLHSIIPVTHFGPIAVRPLNKASRKQLPFGRVERCLRSSTDKRP